MQKLQKDADLQERRRGGEMNEQFRQARLAWMAENKILPFELDFLRTIGFTFALDWDGALLIEAPKAVSVCELTKLISEHEAAIKVRLHCEGERAKSVFVGGPLNGKSHTKWMPNNPICCHISRGQWAVYVIRSMDDPRAWFIGMATSKKKAKALNAGGK